MRRPLQCGAQNLLFSWADDYHSGGEFEMKNGRPPPGAVVEPNTGAKNAKWRSWTLALLHGSLKKLSTKPMNARSTLTTILGRAAAYAKGAVTWDQLLKANERWVFDAKGLKT
jgi:hypothetical protein